MSNRVVVISIPGLGVHSDTAEPLTLTTRPHASYPNALAGTVVSLADQLSSEISVFGSMGSDSTTSFTVLSTEATRYALMSRGKTEVLDPTNGNQPLRVTHYISPDPGPVTLLGIDATNLVVDGFYRIQNTAFQCISTSPVVFERIWGCRAVPIAMMEQSPGSFLGSKIYDINVNKPLGGCEQLPVVIKTIELDGTNSEVIFRGFINKVSNDTSSGQPNLIKVDCSSMMAYLKTAPFTPAWGDVTARLSGSGMGEVSDAENAETLTTVYAETKWKPQLFGDLYNEDTAFTGATRSKLWQIRQEGLGGIAATSQTNPGYVTIDSQYGITYGGTATARDNGYRMFFNDGYYADGNFGPALTFGVDLQDIPRERHDTGSRRRYFRNRTQNAQPNIRGENCLEAYSMAALLIDLLLGSYNADLTMTYGARSVNEAAWLPFQVNNWTDIIDAPSLFALFSGLTSPDVPLMNPALSVTENDVYSTILPYNHTSVKTIGDVLDGILKKLAAFMVYDKGKFYFGSWAGARQTPTFVDDQALSDPSIKLTFEQGLALMRVDATFCTDMGTDDPVKFTVPYQNPDLGSSGLGKTTTVGHWQTNFVPPNDSQWGLTRMVANAFGLLMRYSQSAARVDLSLRDAVTDLQIGQEIALSSSYLVNSRGDLGVSVMTGYVLKAARSWQTPTTGYTIMLPGYLSPAAHVSVWSCSGLVVDVLSADEVEIEPNFFTQQPLLASPGAPISDADAFRATAVLYQGPYDLQVLDQYGTFKAQFTLISIDVPNNRITATGIGSSALPGDIIILAPASYFYNSSFEFVWDVFQADTNGWVNGDPDNARKWVP